MMKIYMSELEVAIENKIKPNLRLIYEMKIKGLKDKHMAAALGISSKIFAAALDSYGEMKEVYEDAMTLLCSRLREVVIERALGTDGRTDRDGNLIGGDANLALRVLEKIDPTFANKEQEVKVVMSVEEVIRELNARRREEIEKQKEIEARRGVVDMA